MTGVQISPAWIPGGYEVSANESNGVTLTIVFTCANPAMELNSVWHSHSGPGPVHLSMFLVNKSDKVVTVYGQESLDVCVTGPGKGTDTSIWYIKDDGSLPDATGVYQDLLAENYRKDISFSEGEDYN